MITFVHLPARQDHGTLTINHLDWQRVSVSINRYGQELYDQPTVPLSSTTPRTTEVAPAAPEVRVISVETFAHLSTFVFFCLDTECEYWEITGWARDVLVNHHSEWDRVLITKYRGRLHCASRLLMSTYSLSLSSYISYQVKYISHIFVISPGRFVSTSFPYFVGHLSVPEHLSISWSHKM